MHFKVYSTGSRCMRWSYDWVNTIIKFTSRYIQSPLKNICYRCNCINYNEDVCIFSLVCWADALKMHHLILRLKLKIWLCFINCINFWKPTNNDGIIINFKCMKFFFFFARNANTVYLYYIIVRYIYLDSVLYLL